MEGFVKRNQAQRLLHNKFVVVLGGSVHRAVYKDLVRLIHTDEFLTPSQLKSKGEHSFESDQLVEGGCLGVMSNGTDYREVRQYHSDHHLLRFYFITQVFSPYMETILEDLRLGLKPDVLIVSSCVWDITRYGQNCLENYKENLNLFFEKIKTVVCQDCLIIWNLAMPLAKQIRGGFLVSEVSHLGPSFCTKIIEANFFSGHLADAYGLDTLDLHFLFRQSLQHRMPDGVHWDAVAHRSISSFLLQHAAQAWGVVLDASPASSPPMPPPPPPAASVSKKKCCKAKVKWRAPPPPPVMLQATRPPPRCLRLAPPGAPLWRPRQDFPRPGFRRFQPLWTRMPPPHPPFRGPPPGPWGDSSGGGCVRWRRPNHRMHPYYPPGPPPAPFPGLHGPRRQMWGLVHHR